MTTEDKTNEIFSKADELRNLLGLSAEEVEVQIDRWTGDYWHVYVTLSLLTPTTYTHLMRRGYSGKTSDEALDNALAGVIEELELYKQGKTRAL